MPQDINLMPQEVLAKRHKTQNVRTFTFISIGIFVVCMLVAVGVFTYETMLMRDIHRYESLSQQELTTIKSLEPVERLALILEMKLKIFENVFGARNFYSKLLEELSVKVPQDVTITDLAVVKPGQIGVSGQAKSYLDLSKFLRALTSSEADIFEAAVLTSVSLDQQSGQANYSLDIYLVEGALNQLAARE